MKNVLFIGVTKYNLEKDVHLAKKFEGLSKGIKPYILAKGKPFHKKIWNSEFYLLPPTIFFWPVAIILAFWLCLVKKIDVIVAQSPLMEGLAGTVLKKLLKKELIVEIHGDWKMRKTFSKLAPLSLKNADKIRAVAQYLIAKAQKNIPNKPYYIFSTFTDLDKFLEERNTKLEKFVLFVGRDHPVKGVKYLTEAFSKIEKDFPDFELVLVGEGLPGGKLPLEEVKKKIKDCYCLVVPSLSEGLPRVIMEAMALGKPVIGSNVGGIPELIKDGQNGFLFESKNSDNLAQKLRILLKDKNLAIEMGQRGREFVEDKFSNEKYISSYIEMINS